MKLPRLIGIGAVIGVLSVAAPVRAQETRAEQVAAEQRAKASALEAEDSPVGETIVKRVMSSPLLAGSGGVYPWIGSVHSGTGIGLGIGVLHRSAYRAQLNALAAVSTNGSLTTSASWKLPSLGARSPLQPEIDGRWSRLRDMAFHAVGPSSPGARERADHTFREVNAGLSVTGGPLTVSGGVGYRGLETERRSGNAFLPGLGESIDYGVSRLGAIVDWRTSPGYSTRGGFLRVDYQRYAALDNAPYSFDQWEFETGHLVPFVREQFGLAFRALATAANPDAGDTVPFVLLPYVGSGNTVRGLETRRYMDRSRVVLTSEYRWRPSRYLDMALFVDTGAVAPRLGEIEQREFRTGYGIGARFHGPAFTALRLEAARGPEGWRIIFTGGQPF